MGLSAPVEITLAMVGQALARSEAPWWIIGSAAAWLHGARVTAIGDIDLLTSATAAGTLLSQLGQVPAAGIPDERFRSEVFGTWRDPPLPVEIMGGLSVAGPQGWRELRPVTREVITLSGQAVFVPSRQELIAIMQSFGRAKDLARIALLRERPM